MGGIGRVIPVSLTSGALMIDVRCICAIGLRGQLGLNGHLPWEGNTDPLFVEDVTRFFALTMGHVLIAGPKTVASVPDFAFKDRTIDVIRSHEDPEQVLKRYPGRRIFVGGGIAIGLLFFLLTALLERTVARRLGALRP